MTKTMPCGCRWDGYELNRCARHREPGSLAVDAALGTPPTNVSSEDPDQRGVRSMKDLPSNATLEKLIGILGSMRLGLNSCDEIRAVADAIMVLRDVIDRHDLEDIAERLNGRSVMIRTRADKNGKLFSWVGQKDIADVIKSDLGVDIQPSQVLLSKSFQELGVFDVSLHLEGTPKIKVWIVKEAPDEPVEPELPEQPEQPKVESLRETVKQRWSGTMYGSDAVADGLALVLYQLDRLAGLMLQHRIDNAVYKTSREALRVLRTEWSQMLEGSE